MPYAIGAKFGHPDRPVIACVGDGAFQMNGMNDLITITKYWQEWRDPRLIALVLHNNDLNQVTWELRAMGGFPKVEQTQVLPDVDYARYAELLRLRGIRVDTPDAVGVARDLDRHQAEGAGVPVDPLVTPYFSFSSSSSWAGAGWAAPTPSSPVSPASAELVSSASRRGPPVP